MKKKVLMIVLLSVFCLMSFASYRELPDFPQKYETWLNYLRYEKHIFRFDIYNYETSYLPHIVGFDSKGSGSNYANRNVARYVEKHRDKLENSVIVYCSFLKSLEEWKYKDLNQSFSSFKIYYDENEFDIKEIFCKDITTEGFGLSSGNQRYFISFLFYIDKDTFLKISKSKTFYLTCKVNNNDYHFDLQVPVVYDDTFQIKPKEELNLPEW